MATGNGTDPPAYVTRGEFVEVRDDLRSLRSSVDDRDAKLVEELAALHRVGEALAEEQSRQGSVLDEVKISVDAIESHTNAERMRELVETRRRNSELERREALRQDQIIAETIERLDAGGDDVDEPTLVRRMRAHPRIAKRLPESEPPPSTRKVLHGFAKWLAAWHTLLPTFTTIAFALGWALEHWKVLDHLFGK